MAQTRYLVLIATLGTPASALAQEAPPDPAPEASPAPEEEEQDPSMNMAESHLDDAAARQHFVAGRSLYDVGNFENAAVEFEEAYRLSNRPELLYNIYVAHRDAGNTRQARDSLASYLEAMDDPPDRVNLEARLQALDTRVAEEERNAQERAEAEARERERQRREALAAAEQDQFNIAPWIVTGIGGAALIAGAITGILALGATSSLEDDCPNDRCPQGFDLEGERDSARTLVILTDYLLLAGGIVAAAGLTWGLLTLGGGDEGEAPTASAFCGPGGCAASLEMGF
ncbi:MAG: hypothetical protein AAGF12_03110 [Myxococcota bacterium]